MKYLPKSERYKEIKHVHVDSMFGESARLQLLKNATDERETMKAQAAIVVPKGETRKRAQITYLIAKVNRNYFIVYVCLIFISVLFSRLNMMIFN